LTPNIRDIITITTTQLNNRGGWSGCIKNKGEGRVDVRFGGEKKGEDVRRDQEGRGTKGRSDGVNNGRYLRRKMMRVSGRE
jgi:hypothetical protein